MIICKVVYTIKSDQLEKYIIIIINRVLLFPNIPFAIQLRADSLSHSPISLSIIWVVLVLTILAVALRMTSCSILKARTIVFLTIILRAVACNLLALRRLVLVAAFKRLCKAVSVLMVLTTSAGASLRVTANAIQEALAISFRATISWAGAFNVCNRWLMFFF